MVANGCDRSRQRGSPNLDAQRAALPVLTVIAWMRTGQASMVGLVAVTAMTWATDHSHILHVPGLTFIGAALGRNFGSPQVGWPALHRVLAPGRRRGFLLTQSQIARASSSEAREACDRRRSTRTGGSAAAGRGGQWGEVRLAVEGSWSWTSGRQFDR